MSNKFSKENFFMIIREIEDMEASDQNIGIPIGILERMYNDVGGYIDYYFHSKRTERNLEALGEKINNTSYTEFLNKTNYCNGCGTQRCERTPIGIDGCKHYQDFVKNNMRVVGQYPT